MPHFDSSIFDLAPIPMWLEDFSEVKLQFDQWRADGVEDLVSFLQADMQRVVASTHKIKIIKVNQKTLEVFEAKDQDHLCENLSKIFKEDMLGTHIFELAALWEGKNEFSSTGVNYTLSGK